MGKIKDKRYRNRHDPLHANGKRRIDVEDTYCVPSHISTGPRALSSTSSGKEKPPFVIEKLASSDPSDKEYACRCVAIFVFTPKYLKQLLKYGVLPRLTSLFIDDSLAVREVSAGAFRNLSLAVLSGGDDLNIATEEVLALLSVLIRECSRCYVAPGLKSKDQELWKAITVQALHVLWNLVELSDKTVRAVEREQLFPVILQFAQVLEDKDVSLPAAQCLLSLSEGNADLCSCVARSCQHVDHIVSCVKKAQKSSSGMVVGVALSGVLCNIATEMSSDKVLNLFNLVHGTLGDVLDVDITSLLAPPTKDTSSSSLVVDAKDSVSDKIRNILSSQMLALEILSNSIAQDEDDWEDMDEEGTGNESVLVTEGPGCDSILLDSVVKHGLAAKVWKRSHFFPSEVYGMLAPLPPLYQKLLEVQCTAMLCLQNLVAALDTPTWGGAHGLQEMTVSLFSSLSNNNQSDQVLEHTLSLLRAVTSEVSSLERKSLNQDQVEVLCRLVVSQTAPLVCVCAVQVLAVVCKQPSSPLHQLIAIAFKRILIESTNELLISEVLDGIFGFDDSALPVVLSSGLLDVMSSLSFGLHQQGTQPVRSGKETAVIDVARTNLPRFIDYVRTQCCVPMNS